MKHIRKYAKEYLPYIICIIAVVLIRTYLVTLVRVDGQSMIPTLKDGEVLVLKKYDKKIERFDIVVLKYNKDKLIKRVIGLPGEHVKYKNGKLYINGKKVDESFNYEETADFDLKELGYDVIPKGYYFVVGDNRDNSLDSRYIGLIKKSDIEGITDFSIFPFGTFGNINEKE